MVYIALLRGVNVGGKSIVSMALLKTCYEALGFSNVKTYINSGNIIFSTEQQAVDVLSKRIESALDQTFDPGIRVLVKARQELEHLVAAIPADWVNDKDIKCDVMFLWPTVDMPATIEQLPSNPEIEDVRYISGAILWRINRTVASKSRMTRIVGSILYKQMTVRNSNTVRKLVTLANELS